MKPSVILIDDDHGPMDYFVEALRRRGFGVTQIDATDKAFEWIENPNSRPPSVFIVDLMLPPGNRLTMEQTDGGLRSGVFIADAIRKRFPNVPIVVLTARTDPDIFKSLPEGTEAKLKFETSPFAFADFVTERLSSPPQDP